MAIGRSVRKYIEDGEKLAKHVPLPKVRRTYDNF